MFVEKRNIFILLTTHLKASQTSPSQIAIDMCVRRIKYNPFTQLSSQLIFHRDFSPQSNVSHVTVLIILARSWELADGSYSVGWRGGGNLHHMFLMTSRNEGKMLVSSLYSFTGMECIQILQRVSVKIVNDAIHKKKVVLKRT